MKNRASFKKGHVQSITTRKNISQKLMGNKNGAGHKMTEANKEKIRIANSKPHSEETKRKISETMMGVPLAPERAARLRKYLRENNSGADNSNWKGGISKINKTELQLAMETIDYRLWRSSVFERDNYTCVICSSHGVRLNADHIKSWSEYPELRYNINNGRTLCEPCHRKTNNYGNRNKTYGLTKGLLLI